MIKHYQGDLIMMKRYIDLVSGAAKRTPAATAVVSKDARLTFSELDRRTGQLGAALRSAGLAPGDRVALLSANELEYPEIQAACLRSGFTLVPLNVRLAMPELKYILADCRPAVLIGGRTEHQRVKALMDAGLVRKVVGLGCPDHIESYDDFIAGAAPDPETDPLAPELPCTILYTSGTTGRPKGAVIDRAGLTARVFVNAVELDASPEDVFLACLPMFHIAAFLSYAYLFRGGAVIMPPEFSPASCFEVMRQERATALVLVPTMIRMLLDSPDIDRFDPSHLKLIVYGGESIPPATLKRAFDRFGCGFHQQYGMTETGAQTILRCADHLSNDVEVLSSAGSDAVSFEVRVVDDAGHDVTPGQKGEIICRGPAVMAGYWNMPEETAETLRNGWMHTGDIGRWDHHGYLHIVDRRKDKIISGGENIYPREVEQVLLGHPQVAEAAVVGLPDPKWGEVVTCVLVGNTPDEEELECYLRDHIAGYKVPRRWVRLGDLPRNSTGKVLKNVLKAQLEKMPIEI